MKRTFVMPVGRANALECVKTAKDGFVVTVAEATRSLEQNAAQWPILEAIAAHCQLSINGVMEWATTEDWKDVLTASYKSEMRVAFYRGRMVLLGMWTSKMGKKQFSEWLDFLNAAAAEMGIDELA